MNLLPPLPLAADLGVIIQAIIFLAILASAAAKMFRDSQEAQRRAEQPQRRPPPQQPQGDARPQRAEAAPQAGNPQAGNPQQDIRREVEEFLRRAAGEQDRPQPAPQQRPPRQVRQPRIELIEDDSGIELVERPKQQSRSPRPAPPAAKPTASSRPPQEAKRGDLLGQRAVQRTRRNEFEERASHFGEKLAQTDERVEARLHHKFDQSLGSLSAERRTREAADKVLRDTASAPTIADNLFAALSSPEGVQQAIVLSEILNRPADRW